MRLSTKTRAYTPPHFAMESFIVKILGRVTHIGEFYTFIPATFAIHINSVHQRGEIYIPGDTNKILCDIGSVGPLSSPIVFNQ